MLEEPDYSFVEQMSWDQVGGVFIGILSTPPFEGPKTLKAEGFQGPNPCYGSKP